MPIQMPPKIDGYPAKLSMSEIEVGEHTDLYAVGFKRDKQQTITGFTKPKQITHVLHIYGQTITAHSGGNSHRYATNIWYFYRKPKVAEKEPEQAEKEMSVEEKIFKMNEQMFTAFAEKMGDVFYERMREMEKKLDPYA